MWLRKIELFNSLVKVDDLNLLIHRVISPATGNFLFVRNSPSSYGCARFANALENTPAAREFEVSTPFSIAVLMLALFVLYFDIIYTTTKRLSFRRINETIWNVHFVWVLVNPLRVFQERTDSNNVYERLKYIGDTGLRRKSTSVILYSYIFDILFYLLNCTNEKIQLTYWRCWQVISTTHFIYQIDKYSVDERSILTFFTLVNRSKMTFEMSLINNCFINCESSSKKVWRKMMPKGLISKTIFLFELVKKWNVAKKEGEASYTHNIWRVYRFHPEKCTLSKTTDYRYMPLHLERQCCNGPQSLLPISIDWNCRDLGHLQWTAGGLKLRCYIEKHNAIFE